MIVSLGLFSVVATIVVGSLLILISSNRQFQVEQSIMTNLSFAIDSMTREIRTGTSFYCEYGSSQSFISDLNNKTITDTQDCYGNNFGGFYAISFVETGNSITDNAGDRITYYYDKTTKSIFRRVESNQARVLTSSDIEITDMSIFVTGTEAFNSSSPNNVFQPTVTIYIEAQEKGSGSNGQKYKLQTTVTQRTLDV